MHLQLFPLVRMLRVLTISCVLLTLAGATPAVAQSTAACLQGWLWESVPSAASNTSMVGQPSAITWHQDEHGLRDDVFARGVDGDLVQYFRFAGSGWRPAKNLTSAAPGNHKIHGDPVAVVGQQRVNNKTYSRHDVFAVGPNEDLIHYWWSEEPPSGWKAENLTTNLGGLNIVTQPEVRNSYYLHPSGERRLKTDVYSTDVSGDVIQYWWTRDHGWDYYNLSQASNSGSLLAYKGISVADSWSSPPSHPAYHHILGTDASGHLIDHFWSPSASWQSEDLTRLTGLQTSPRITSQTAVPPSHGSALWDGIFGFQGSSLVRYWSRGPSLPWNSENVTANAGFWMGTPELVHSRPAVARSRQISGPNPPIDVFERYDVFARDVHGDLIHYWSYDPWSAFSSGNGFVTWYPGENLTQLHHGLRLSSDPLFVVRLHNLWDSEHYVFARSGSSLVSYCWSGVEGWATLDLQSATPKLGEGLAGDPRLIQYSTRGMSLYAASPQGDLLHYWKP